jgi:hypothetical protein
MNRRSLNRVKQKRKEGVPPQSSTLKRKRKKTSSSEPTTPTPAAAAAATAREPDSFSPLQNDSTSERTSFEYENKNSTPLKTAQTPIKKTPQCISKAISKLYDDLSQKTYLDSAKKREASYHFKEASKLIHSEYNGQCDTEAILNDWMEDVIWKQFREY